MRTRIHTAAAALALLLALAGCASTPAATSDGAASTPTAMDYSGSSSGDVGLEVEDTSLGEIVVDGKGMTVYMFDKDTQGTTASACTGQCLTNWPIVMADDGVPEVEGVTGALATIDTPDGHKQLTLNGWPLYYFSGDSAKGDVNGQGVGGIWWVLSPAGERMAG